MILDDLDTPEARIDMIRPCLKAIIDGSASPFALARAALDFCDLTEAERLCMRGEAPAPASDDWRWWSGTSDEWYRNGPFATCKEAIEALDGFDGHVTEAYPAAPVHLQADQLIESQYFEDNDSFDYDHGIPDRVGPVDAIATADAELQGLLDGWCRRHGHTFERGNIFRATRNGRWIGAPPSAAPAMVEADSTLAPAFATVAPKGTGGAR